MSTPEPQQRTPLQLLGVVFCTIGFACCITLIVTQPMTEWWWYPLAVLNATGFLIDWYGLSRNSKS